MQADSSPNLKLKWTTYLIPWNEALSNIENDLSKIMGIIDLYLLISPETIPKYIIRIL